jgi:hypothetical protein
VTSPAPLLCLRRPFEGQFLVRRGLHFPGLDQCRDPHMTAHRVVHEVYPPGAKERTASTNFSLA